MSLDWKLVTMPGPWIGDEWHYGVAEYQGRLYREHDGHVQVMTDRGWRGVPTLTDDGVKLTPDEAVLSYDREQSVRA